MITWRMNDFGWTVELYLDGSDIHEVENKINSCRLVFPHLGQFQRTVTTQQRGFSLNALIDRDTWVKISALILSLRQPR